MKDKVGITQWYPGSIDWIDVVAPSICRGFWKCGIDEKFQHLPVSSDSYLLF
jgi:hypothetical protein